MAILEAVSPDNKETDLEKVKIRVVPEEISPEELAAIRKHVPDFEPPAATMTRLELVDKEIDGLKQAVAAAQIALTDADAALAAKVKFRAEAEAVAKTVKLAVAEVAEIKK